MCSPRSPLGSCPGPATARRSAAGKGVWRGRASCLAGSKRATGSRGGVAVCGQSFQNIRSSYSRMQSATRQRVRDVIGLCVFLAAVVSSQSQCCAPLLPSLCCLPALQKLFPQVIAQLSLPKIGHFERISAVWLSFCPYVETVGLLLLLTAPYAVGRISLVAACLLILNPRVLGIIQGCLGEEVGGVEGDPLGNGSDGPLEEYDLLHEQRHVKLLLDFLLGFSEHGHPAPVFAAGEAIEDSVEEVAEVVEEVELFGTDVLLVVVAVEPAGEAELVAELVVGVEDEDESEDGADESAHVGEQGVDLLVGARVGDEGAGLFEVDHCVGVGEDGDGAVLEEAAHLDPRFHQGVLEGQDALVGLDPVLLDFGVGLHCEGGGEGEEVLLLQVVLLVVLAEGGVQLRVQQHHSQPEVPQPLLQQLHLLRARAPAPAALAHRQREAPEDLGGDLALDGEGEAEGRAEEVGAVEGEEGAGQLLREVEVGEGALGQGDLLGADQLGEGRELVELQLDVEVAQVRAEVEGVDADCEEEAALRSEAEGGGQGDALVLGVGLQGDVLPVEDVEEGVEEEQAEEGDDQQREAAPRGRAVLGRALVPQELRGREEVEAHQQAPHCPDCTHRIID